MFYSDVFLGQDDRPLKMSLELEYQFRYELPVGILSSAVFLCTYRNW